LENDFIKVMILPELGGRVQQAVDKTNGYNFVYHNQVINGEWPENLGEGKLSAATENERWLKLGQALRAQGKTAEAIAAFQKATWGG
jgi:hypothetical protein